MSWMVITNIPWGLLMTASQSVSFSETWQEHVWGHRGHAEGYHSKRVENFELASRHQWLFAPSQLNYAESRLTQLEGCHCERTCSANGLVYRDKELWVEPENCRNCACKVSVVGVHTKRGHWKTRSTRFLILQGGVRCLLFFFVGVFL